MKPQVERIHAAGFCQWLRAAGFDNQNQHASPLLTISRSACRRSRWRLKAFATQRACRVQAPLVQHFGS